MVTDHPNYANIASFVASLVAKCDTLQATFFTSNLRYFQGMRIPEGQTDGLTPVAIDPKLFTPHQPGDTWYAFDKLTFKVNLKIFLNVTMERYSGPYGHAYCALFEFWYPGLGPDNYGVDGDHWRYAHAFGPDQPGLYEPYDEWVIVPPLLGLIDGK